jgi:hypothetical protein
MRCVGADKPPCVRCSKSRRECIVSLPNRQNSRTTLHSYISADLNGPQNGHDRSSDGGATYHRRHNTTRINTRAQRLAPREGQELSMPRVERIHPEMPSPESRTSTSSLSKCLHLPSIFSTSAMNATSPCTSRTSDDYTHAEGSRPRDTLRQPANRGSPNNVLEDLSDMRLAQMIEL